MASSSAPLFVPLSTPRLLSIITQPIFLKPLHHRPIRILTATAPIKSVDVSKEEEQPLSSPEGESPPPPENTIDKRRLEEKFAVVNTGLYECRSCGYNYNESSGDPSYPIPPGLPFDRLPDDWRCPTCGASQSFFQSKSLEIAGFAENQQFGFGEKTNLLHSEVLKDEAVARLIELGKVSDTEEYLERTFQSPASVRAGNLIRLWMEDAGLLTWVDQMGNVHGRHDGLNPSEKALLIGSHLDTVIDAGKFDGALGIISALSALKVLKNRGTLGKLRRPVEVIAFSDEEGVRFQSTFLGSAAIAGVLPVSTLHVHDKSGVTVQGALRKNSIEITEENLSQLKYNPESVFGYIEVHIEQGPVLETVGLPLGLVKGIAGQTRLRVSVKGSQGHAGTVPMKMRQDPMAAAAEMIVFLESLCKQPQDYLSYDSHCTASAVKSLAGSLVCTVGEISTWPSASNVIPGQVTFTVDIRAMDDLGREAIIYELSNRMYHICDKRSVLCVIERKHDANGVACDPELSSELKSAAYSALKRLSDESPDDVPILMSGAGHDAMAMSHLTKVAMLFVRCRGGVSHSPAEYVSDDDVWASGMAVLTFLETLL